MIQKIDSEVYSNSCTNSYHDVTFFKVDRILQKIKIWICQERHMTFLRNEKIFKFNLKNNIFNTF